KIKAILQLEILTPVNKLKEISRAFIRFSLENKNMYTILIGANSTRVDLEETELQINKVRLDLFRHMRDAIQACCSTDDADQLLGYARICFYTLNGVITTYLPSKESYSELIERLGSTFDTAIEILVTGFNKKEEK
ncbi:MAG TPA: hypothetical protein VLK78_09625, partial [Candidatus Angelobacter sp.]|nr:hypothetical protein [Candidatus Angelobacter sp.]